MTEYLKTAKAKIAELGSMLGQKAKDTSAAAVQVSTGNAGALGAAKKTLANPQEKIDKAVDEALGMANGGVVGRKAQRG